MKIFENKKGEFTTTQIVVVLLALALVLNIGGITTKLKELGGIGTTTTTETPATGERCYIEDTTLTLGPAEERYNPATKATTDYHRLFKGGVDKGLYLDGSTVTVNPGDTIDIYWAENSSGYYAAKQSFTIPCKGEVTSGEQPDSDAYKLFANAASTFDIKVFNEDNGNLNTDDDNETLGAGDVVSLPVQIVGVFEDGYSPYKPLILVVEGNKSQYDDFVAGSFPKATVPDQHVVRDADSKNVAFEVPSCISNCKIDFNLVVDVDDTVNPSGSGTNASQVVLTLYDADWYQDDSTGAEILGYESSTDADVGTTNYKQGIFVN